MKKMMIALATSTLALAGVSVAHAATFTPASSTINFSGSVDVSKDISLTCTMTATVATTALDGSGDNTAAVTAANLTDGLCGLVNFDGFNWPVTVTASSGGAATELGIAGVEVTTVFGGFCDGDVTVDWTNGSGATLTFPSPTVLDDCEIEGTLTSTSSASIAP